MPELRGLYAVTPAVAEPVQWLRGVEQALAGGCRWLQYRDKTADAALRRARAEALQQICRQYGAALLINDDLALALAVGADGLHLGRNDGDLAAARAALGPHKVLGASCYADFSLAAEAKAAGADYVAFGAVFSSPTKPEAVRAPLALLGRARRELGLPVCAIGGITVGNAETVIAAGADLVAVITDLFSAPDVAVRAAQFQSLFKEHP